MFSIFQCRDHLLLSLSLDIAIVFDATNLSFLILFFKILEMF